MKYISGQRSWIVYMEIRYRAFEISLPNLVAKGMEFAKQLVPGFQIIDNRLWPSCDQK